MERESKVICTKCERKNTITEEKISEEDKRRILCPEYGIEKRKPW